MSGGIIQTALTKALALELEYSEPVESRHDEATQFGGGEDECYPQDRYGSANEFHQLLAAI